MSAAAGVAIVPDHSAPPVQHSRSRLSRSDGRHLPVGELEQLAQLPELAAGLPLRISTTGCDHLLGHAGDERAGRRQRNGKEGLVKGLKTGERLPRRE